MNYKVLNCLTLLCFFSLVGCSTGVVRYQSPASVSLEKSFELPKELTQLVIKSSDENLESVIAQFKKLPEVEFNYQVNLLYSYGVDLKEVGELKKALKVFKFLYQIYPADYSIKKNYVVTLVRSGELEESERVLTEIIKTHDKKDTSFKLILAGLYSAQAKIKESKKVYQEILQIEPNNEEACVFLAKSYGSEEKFKQAQKILKSCISKDKENPVLHFYLGKLHLANKKVKAADKSFAKALEVSPYYYQAAIARSIIKDQEGKKEEALKILVDYLKKDEENFAILSKVTQYMFELGKSLDAVPFVEEMFRQDPNNINLQVRLGILYSESAQYDEAKSLFKEILQKAPGSDKILYYLGALYQETSDFLEAIDFYSKIKPESELYFDSNVQIGRILKSDAMVTKTYRNGVSEIQKLVEMIPDDFERKKELELDLRVIQASLYEENNEFQKGLALITQFHDVEEMELDHKYFVANLYERSNQYEKAIDLMTTVLEKNPNNPHALNFIGYVMLENGGKLEVAFEYIDKAIKILPKDAYIRDSLGWYYYKKGDLKKALKELKKAWNDEKKDVVITKHLAIVYQELNKTELAAEFFEEALRNCSKESERMDILKSMEGNIMRRFPASLIPLP